MEKRFSSVFTSQELYRLSLIIQVGEDTYRELLETQPQIFEHPYLTDLKGRVRTKLVQMQCEIESRSPDFPFEFGQCEFQFKQIIPELRNKNVILHIAQSASPKQLPYASKYKIALSNNNRVLQRQLIIDLDQTPPYRENLYYGIVALKDEFLSSDIEEVVS